MTGVLSLVNARHFFCAKLVIICAVCGIILLTAMGQIQTKSKVTLDDAAASHAVKKYRRSVYAMGYRMRPEVVKRRKQRLKESREKYPELKTADYVCACVHGVIKSRMRKTGKRASKIIGYDVGEIGEWAVKNGYNPPHTHIDHIIPVSWWIKRYPNDINRAMKGAWNLANLRVIPAEDNLRKSATREHLV